MLLSSSDSGKGEASHSSREDSHFVYCGDADTLGKHIEVCTFNAMKKRVIDRDQHPQSGAAFAIDERKQLLSRDVVVLSASANFSKKRTLIGSGRLPGSPVQQ